MRFSQFLLPVAAAVTLAGCASAGGGSFGYGGYSLVQVRETRVGDDSMAVTPPREWNKISASLLVDIHVVEDWTQNGPYLDGISFVTGLKDGKALVHQRSRDDRQVPKFRSNMTSPEIAAMIESLFRVRAGAVDFKTVSLAPRAFMGFNGFQYDYEHLDGDEVRRKGRAVGAVIDGRLYLILFDAARSHYYGALLPDFEAIVGSARLVWRPTGSGGGGGSGSPGRGGTWPGSSAGGGPPGRGGLLAIMNCQDEELAQGYQCPVAEEASPAAVS